VDIRSAVKGDVQLICTCGVRFEVNLIPFSFSVFLFSSSCDLNDQKLQVQGEYWMRLNRIEISNFRSIQSQTVKFDPRCRILVGKNEVGKSNVLAACSLIDEDVAVLASDLRETRDDEDPVSSGYVRFIFSLSTSELDQLKRAVSTKILGKDIDLVAIGTTKLSIDAYAGKFNESLLIVDLPSGTRRHTHWSKSLYKLEQDWLTLKDGSEAIEIQIGGKPHRVERGSVVHRSLLHPGQEHLLVAADKGSIDQIYRDALAAIAAKKIPKCLFWKYSESLLLPAGIDIESFKSNPNSCEPLKAMFLLAGYKDPAKAIKDAQQSTNGLKNLLSRVARLSTKHVKSRWKEIGTVEIVLTPNGGQIDAAVKDAFNEYSFSRRSEGFKRFMSFLLLISARSIAKDFSEILFIQDEPDLGLHPTGVKSLLNELIELSKENYVLVSTHSIFLIDKERIDRHLIAKKIGEVTTLSDVDRSKLQDEEVLFNALGYSLFDLIKPTNLVFEGWRDKKLFLTFIKTRKVTAKYLSGRVGKDLGAVHAMGVKDIPKVVSYFEAIERKSVVVSDSDQVAVEKQKALAGQSPEVEWKRYDQLSGEAGIFTAEDYIRPQRLRKALEETLSGAGVLLDVPQETFHHPVEGGCVMAVDRLLTGQVPSVEDRKSLINNWKSRIFDDLSVEDVDERYEAVANGLARLFGFVG
jgi:hypothetical protein